MRRDSSPGACTPSKIWISRTFMGANCMEQKNRRIWWTLIVLVLAIITISFGDSLRPIDTEDDPFRIALSQLGILYIVALIVERSLEVIIKAWRQADKSHYKERVRLAEDDDSKAEAQKELEKYRTGTQKRALIVGFILGIFLSVFGIRFLGAIFYFSDVSGWSFQQGMFQFIDIILTAGLIAGGSATIHELMALIDDFLKSSRKRT